MVVVPAVIPVTTPPETVATEVLLLLHVPPPAASESEVVKPIHAELTPDIVPAEGEAFTVTTAETEQPAADVKLIIEVPVVPPVTSPVEAPIVATVVLLLVHVPAPAASLRLVVPPAHKLSVPEIGDIASTVTTAISGHPPLLV